MLRLLTNDNVFLLFLLWTFACILGGCLLHWSWAWLTHWSLHFHTRPSPRDFERWGRALYAANNWHFLLPDSVVLAWLDSVSLTRSQASSCAPRPETPAEIRRRYDESDLRHVPSTPPAPAPTEAQILAGALSGGRHHDARGHVLSGCAVRAAIQMEEAGLEPAALVGSMTMVQSEPMTMYPARVEANPKSQ